ncbi:4-alpha-glucanotransferase [Luteolibacter algae]|uniref:4-alpha-glucanotransferase n=1 Tax=Luteolibacter algae TaxID=454151 RepID=A0ABW5D210_9BACT
MNLVFRVAYRTVVGESLWLKMGLAGESGLIKQTVPMKWKDAEHWEVQLEVEIRGEVRLEYEYVLKRAVETAENSPSAEEVTVREWGGARKLPLSETRSRVLMLDDWRSAGSDDYVYEAKVFTVIDGSDNEVTEYVGTGNHELNLHIARVPEGWIPCVMGGFETLGEWDYSRAVPMHKVAPFSWRVSVDLPVDWEVEYKYGFYDPVGKKAVRLEDGENRLLQRRDKCDFVKISDEAFGRAPDMKFRAAGVAIPVFSLRSDYGCGVGEFADLKVMGDWAAAVNLKMLQILPINDTTSSRTWTDSYPYSAISVYALHPLYLRIDEMSFPLTDPEAFTEEKCALNKARRVDYEAVMEVKWRRTREVFEKNHDAILRDPGFVSFLQRNRDWVLDYAVFSVKRDEFGTAVFSEWGDWAVYQKAKADSFAMNPDVMYYVWLQFELDLQLSAAVDYLHSLGVGLKGDLPIGVDRDSVDAWVAPHLFKMNAQTGAPPDAFAVKGQNWGFPTYDWDEMAKDGYAWWRSRFEKLSRYFDAYRIDHILGFFRIWQVPFEHLDGIMGWFDPALPVTLEEFERRGIAFDYDRFCKPFIREKMLKEKFGKFADGVLQDFLKDYGLGCYGMKPQFATQKGIMEFFSELKPGDWANQEWLRDGLLDLVSEVLFFEVEGSGGTEFHPRMRMEDTLSFKDLDEGTRIRLKELYEDYFFSRQEAYWEEKAYEKLPAMRAASDMLLCGEDLGMVPACVPGVMSSMGMLSLEIQRWPKVYGSAFFHPAHAPYMSVVSTGTHDMETLRSWWRSDEKVRANFAWAMFGVAFPEKDLSGEMARRIIEQHLWSPAMWAVFPFQDLLAMDEELRSNDVEGERINVPAIIPFYWRWRMEMTVEKLSKAAEFNAKLRDLISTAGR